MTWLGITVKIAALIHFFSCRDIEIGDEGLEASTEPVMLVTTAAGPMIVNGPRGGSWS